jgi:cytidylate kinase
MSAITVSRQLGSLGDELALEVARRLGWRRVCRDLINQAAVKAGVPQVALAELDELDFFGLRPTAADWQAYQRQVERFITELADGGKVVIVGRGGQMVLRGRPDVLHVRVVAPLETRVTRLRQERNISEEAARACLESSYKARARYIQRSYSVELDDPGLYHLVINTGLLDLDQAVTLVVRALHDLTGEAASV